MDVLVLLSGGIDSTACIEYYLSRGYKVSALHIDYGQPHAEQEQKAVSSIAAYYGIKLQQLSITDLNFEEGYVPSRNAALLCLALMATGGEYSLVALGIHAGTPYADCSPEFVRLLQCVFDLYEQGRVRVSAPFLTWTKSEIWDYAQMQNVPVNLTYSNNLKDLQPVADYLRNTSE